jgi:glycosyltransferase involved in cell wall biosynthesis
MALVMPSFDEGFGLGAVEAAACGTPVIATANSPLPQLLAGGGYFIDPRRPDELNAALRRLLRDDDHRRNLGRIAQEQASKLTWERAAGQFCELLDGIEANGQ